MSWFEFIICQGFQLPLHLKIMNFKHRYVKVCRILCWKPLLLSHQESTRGLQQVCKWYQADKKPHQVFRLLHKDEVLLPSKLMDKACVTSARCVRATLWNTLKVLLGQSVHVGYFH